MDRIFGDGAVPNLTDMPTVREGNGIYFSGGDPLQPSLATKVSPWWLNLVQEALMHPIEAAGLTGSLTAHDQLTQAIIALSRPELSMGMPGFFALGGMTVNWALSTMPLWANDTDGKFSETVAFIRPFQTACRGVWLTPMVTNSQTSDSVYSVIGTPTTTSVTVLRRSLLGQHFTYPMSCSVLAIGN